MQSPEQITQKNIQFLSNTTEEDLITWMFEGMELERFSYHDDGPKERNLLYVFEHAPTGIKEKINSVLATAINQWDPEKHDPNILISMALVAAYTRNKAPISTLIDVIDSSLLPGDSKEEKYNRTIIISIIAGFSKEENVRSALERWFYDPNFDWENTAILLVGLTSSAPGEADKWLSEALLRFDAHPNHFRYDFITGELYDRLGKNRLEELLRESPTESAKKMLEALPSIEEIYKECEADKI